MYQMNQQSIAGFLLFKKPNQYTKPCPTSPNVFILPMECSCNGLSQNEIFAIGTRCGTIPFHQARPQEYLEFKQGKRSMEQIIFHYDSMLTLDQYRRDWRFYYNRQMKRWFGDDLIDVY